MIANGVSIIICCYNSSKRLLPTLTHIARQKDTLEIPWEIIIIDNASTDNTFIEANRIASLLKINCSLRIIKEARQGLIYARQKGLAEAKFEFASFIDDDNWISENWVRNIYDLMMKNTQVGACGGSIEPEFESPAPSWFAKVKSSYAIGNQYHESGIMDFRIRNFLWGAGITIRKTAYKRLVDSGFKSFLTGRKGKSLSAGEDSELCLALQIAGYKLYYSEQLTLKHFIPSERLALTYCKKLYLGFGASSIPREALRYYYEQNTEQTRIFRLWLYEIYSSLTWILRSLRVNKDIDSIMQQQYYIGRILQLANAKGYYCLKESYHAAFLLKTEVNKLPKV